MSKHRPRLSDIEPYTPWGNYTVNVGLNYLEKWIGTHEKEPPYLQLQPDFQRAHVWTEAQQISYMEHLLRGGRSGRDILTNCPGWTGGRTEGPYVLVDGLQRLTACLRFLRNEIPVFGHRRLEYVDGDVLSRVRFDLKWHVNELETRAEVLRFYLQLNAGGTVHTPTEINRVRALLEREEKRRSDEASS
jgi:hypothetical protein